MTTVTSGRTWHVYPGHGPLYVGDVLEHQGTGEAFRITALGHNTITAEDRDGTQHTITLGTAPCPYPRSP